MSSIGSYSSSSFYSPSFSRAVPVRPVSAGEQLPKSIPDPLSGPVTNPADAAQGSRGSEAFTVAEPRAADATGNEQRVAQVRQELAGKEAELEMVEQAEVRELSARDREVRAHEQAHMAVGGQYAGGVSYDYTRGPDRRLYATGGSVSIDISPVAGDPAATIDKMQQVQRAALAPAEPSGQDRAVAAQAAQLIAQARAEMAVRNIEEGAPANADSPSDEPARTAQAGPIEAEPVATGTRELATYRQVGASALPSHAAFNANA